MIILLCSVYVSAINRPNGGHFETHIHGYQYLDGVDITCSATQRRLGGSTYYTSSIMVKINMDICFHIPF